MKKILVATTVLAMTGGAFASDVSGYAIHAYQSMDDGKGNKASHMYTETEAYISGSKTTANGLTFGGTLTVGHDGKNENYTKNAYTHVNTYVSGVFGKVATGRLSAAGRAIGAPSLAVGNGVSLLTNHGIARNRTGKGTFVYTSPSISGVTVAYSSDYGQKKNMDDTTVKSFALKYAGDFDGFMVAAALNMDSVLQSFAELADYKDVYTGMAYKDLYTDYSSGSSNTNFKEKGLGIQLGYQGAKFSYTTTDRQLDMIDGISASDSQKDKETRFGLEYMVSGVTLGFSQNSLANDKNDNKKVSSVLTVKYMVAEGLTVFIEQGQVKKSGIKVKGVAVEDTTDKTLSLGTKISF